MDEQKALAGLLDDFLNGKWDGDAGPSELASEFFNSPAQIDKVGDVYLSDRHCWADQEQTRRLCDWLIDNHHMNRRQP